MEELFSSFFPFCAGKNTFYIGNSYLVFSVILLSKNIYHCLSENSAGYIIHHK